MSMDGFGKIRDATPSSEGIEEFSEHIEFDGLPYIFKGRVSRNTKNVDLFLYIPNWKEEVAKIPKNPTTPYHLIHDGEIGIISLGASGDKTADTVMGRVRSHAGWLSEDSKYRNAHIGRFMMDNLLAITDMNKWSVSAFPYTDGRLSDDDVLDWLNRKGFDELGIRKPQQVEENQPVVKILRK